jgi:hypothetical protein
MLLPVHLGKISLANHSWDEPLRKISPMARNEPFLLLTPRIGEKINLRDGNVINTTSKWWEL